MPAVVERSGSTSLDMLRSLVTPRSSPLRSRYFAGTPSSLADRGRITRRRGPSCGVAHAGLALAGHRAPRDHRLDQRAGRAGWAKPWRVVVADHQSEGRGRLARTWEAPPGTSVAVSATVPVPSEGSAGCRCWPGSRWPRRSRPRRGWPRTSSGPTTSCSRTTRDRKVCGVLCEVMSGPGESVVVVGAGHQHRPGPRRPPRRHGHVPGARGGDVGRPEPARRGIPLPPVELVCGADRRRGGAAARRLPGAVRHGRADRHAQPAGRPDVVGTAEAVDDDGRLVIDGPDGRHAWAAGDVTHVRSAR